jgi:hypothetical protein
MGGRIQVGKKGIGLEEKNGRVKGWKMGKGGGTLPFSPPIILPYLTPNPSPFFTLNPYPFPVSPHFHPYP